MNIEISPKKKKNQSSFQEKYIQKNLETIGLWQIGRWKNPEFLLQILLLFKKLS